MSSETGAEHQAIAESFVAMLAAKSGVPAASVVVLDDEGFLCVLDATAYEIRLGQRWVNAPLSARRALLAHEVAHTLEPRRVVWITFTLLTSIVLPVVVAAAVLSSGIVQSFGAALAITCCGLAGAFVISKLEAWVCRRHEFKADSVAARWGFSLVDPSAREWALGQPDAPRFVVRRTHPSWKARVAAVERLDLSD